MNKKFIPAQWLLMFQIFVSITLNNKERLDHMKWHTEKMRRSWNLAWVNIRDLSIQLDKFVKTFDRSTGTNYPIENDTHSNEYHQDVAESLAYDCVTLLLESPNPGGLVRLMEVYNKSNCNLQINLIAEAYLKGEVEIINEEKNEQY